MALESFLINPHPRRTRRTRRLGTLGRRTTRRKHKGLPSSLLRRMMRTYGPGQGMKRAWDSFRKGIRRNPWEDDAAGHRRASLKGWRRRRGTTVRRHRRNPWASVTYPRRTTRLWRSGTTGRFGVKRAQKNPFGEEVLIVGNPRRRRTRRHRRVSLFNRVRRHRRRRAFSFNPRRRHYRRHRRSYAMNPRRRHYRRHYARNRIHRRRRYHRNPAATAGVPAISLRNPMSFLMPAAIGTAGFFGAEMLPGMVAPSLITTPYMRLGVKAGIALGGGMILGRFMGRKNGFYFAIGAGISLLSDIVRTYILKTTTVAGLGAFPYQMGAYPGEFGDVGDLGVNPYGANAPAYGSGYPM